MKRILIIEDNKLLREEISDALEFEGFKVHAAVNGDTGIDHAIIHQPDLVLCDILLPEADGYEVLRQLRNNEHTRLIPFIFITSLSDRASLRHGMVSGADDYITKPFTIKELINAIHTRLEKYDHLQTTASLDKIEESLKFRLKTMERKINLQQSHINHMSQTKELLTETLKQKESELLEVVVKSVETSNILHLLKNQLEKELRSVSINGIQRKLLLDLVQNIDRINTRKDNLRIFQLKFNQLYPEFIARITREYPTLTQLELTLISTILFNLNSNQVAALLSISTDSVRKCRYRLKKKLNLSQGENLFHFIHNFQIKAK